MVFLTEEKKQDAYWNIPIANTTCILLGTGTSITQAAVRLMSAAGVMLGFCGGGGTPLIAANEIEWLSPQSEYRPTEYVQGWLSFWFDEEKRLLAAKHLQLQRIDFIGRVFNKNKRFLDHGFTAEAIQPSLDIFQEKIALASETQQLLQAEAQFTKALYKFAARNTNEAGFKREHRSEDPANQFLDHGNYLAYGLGATALWVLGIPHGFAVMHGKTRRGALVFDAADLIKDAIILPNAFISVQEAMTEQDFRKQCLQDFVDHKALVFIFNTLKHLALHP